MTERGREDAMLFYEMAGFMPGHADDAMDGTDLGLPRPEEACFLTDFDGTLVEIADRPMDVVVPDGLPDLLKRIHDRTSGRMAVVSGRSIDALEHFLPDFPGDLVGTHGAETRIDGARAAAGDYDLATVSRLQRLVEDFVALQPRFLMETKPFGVVLHYRQAEEQAGLALRFMESLAAAAEGFRLQPALMAYELKPESVGKDIGIETLLALPGWEGKTPIFAGDDLTDEPAIETVQKHGGVGIKIGEAESAASYRLSCPRAFIAHLETWLA